MPKMKSRKSATKRFKVTGTGKVLFQRAGMRQDNSWEASAREYVAVYQRARAMAAGRDQPG